MLPCGHSGRIQRDKRWTCMTCGVETPPGCDLNHQPGCGCTEAKEDAMVAELARLREALEWQVAISKAAHESQERLANEIKELRKLAYIADHYFPDLTWKARCEETVAKLRELEEDLPRLQRMEAAVQNLWEMHRDNASPTIKALALNAVLSHAKRTYP